MGWGREWKGRKGGGGKTYFSRSSKVDAKNVPGTATQHVEVAHPVPQNIGLARQGDPLSVGDVLREVQVTATPTE